MREIRKPFRINRDGFPDPGTSYVPGSPPAEVEEQFFASLAHRAVHGGDPEDRRLMVDYAARWLVEGRELPPSLREWLVFVLHTLEDSPHRHTGRPSDRRAELEFLTQLAKFEYEYVTRHPKLLRKQFKLDAQEHFHVSEPTLKRALADPRYKIVLASHRKDQ